MEEIHVKSEGFKTASEINKNLINTELELEETYKQSSHISINKIQAAFRTYIIRKNWIRIKQNLIESENELIVIYQEMMKSSSYDEIEKKFNAQYEKNDWRKFYDNSSIDEFHYGRLFYQRIRVYDREAYYIGNINVSGEKHGFGVLINITQKYEGFWRNNSFFGWGRITNKSETISYGYFQNGILNGKGEIKTSNSNYIGDFMNGMKHGVGTWETEDAFYSGSFKLNKREGTGKLRFKNLEDVYEGEFNNNCITGYGYYIWKNNETYLGTFINGKMHGRGIYKWVDGSEYEGEYIDNRKEGFGKFKWANGRIYEGKFSNGKPHGIGKLFYNGIWTDVEFKEGKIIVYRKEKIITTPEDTS